MYLTGESILFEINQIHQSPTSEPLLRLSKENIQDIKALCFKFFMHKGEALLREIFRGFLMISIFLLGQLVLNTAIFHLRENNLHFFLQTSLCSKIILLFIQQSCSMENSWLKLIQPKIAKYLLDTCSHVFFLWAVSMINMPNLSFGVKCK